MDAEIYQVLAATRGDQLEIFSFLDIIKVLLGKFDFFLIEGLAEIIFGQHENDWFILFSRADLSNPTQDSIIRVILLIDGTTENKNICILVLFYPMLQCYVVSRCILDLNL